MSKLIFKCRTIFAGSLEIYSDKVVVKKCFGLISNTVPRGNIANIRFNNLANEMTIETSGGKEITKIVFWSISAAKRVKKELNL